jgi:hypothetical protein
MSKKKIEITQKDIDKGIGGSCNHCAIAIALKRQFKTDDIYVGMLEGESAVIQIKKRFIRINEEDQETVNDFIIDFDNFRDYKNLGMDMPKPEPFSFELEEVK